MVIELEEPNGLPVPEAKPAETLVPEESLKEPGAEPGTEVAVVEPPVGTCRARGNRKAEKEMDRSPEPGPVVWWTEEGQDQRPDQLENPVPHCRPFQRPSRSRLPTNATRVVNVLPTAVAYPRYACLHPALPKAGDRQVAKTYFDDGAKAQKSKELQRAKAAYPQATASSISRLVRGAL